MPALWGVGDALIFFSGHLLSSHLNGGSSFPRGRGSFPFVVTTLLKYSMEYSQVIDSALKIVEVILSESFVLSIVNSVSLCMTTSPDAKQFTITFLTCRVGCE